MNNQVLIDNITAACEAKGEKVTPACVAAGVGKSFISNLRRGQSPSVASVSALAEYLGVTTSELLSETDPSWLPKNYILRKGVFHNWDEILKYRLEVFTAIRKLIPGGMKMKSLDPHRSIIAALDIYMHYDFNEPKLLNWFNECVENVEILSISDDTGKMISVNVRLKPCFEALCIEYRQEHPQDQRIVPVQQGISEFLERQKTFAKEPDGQGAAELSDPLDAQLTDLLRRADPETKRAMIVLLQQKQKPE